jgi:hypothetical protein
MSTNFKVPPTGLNKDPSINPTTGSLYTQKELAAFEREHPLPTTLGFSGKPGAVATGISGRNEREVDSAYLIALQQPAHTERGRSPLRASGLMSATLADARARAIRIYREEFDRTRVLLDKMEQAQSEQHRERGRAQSQHREQGRAQSPQHGPAQQRARPRSHSPQHGPAQHRARPRSHSPEKYPAPKNKEDAFAILRISPNSTIKEIRRAYLTRAMELHPDKHSDKNSDVKKEKEEQFKQLGAAINLINDLGQNGGRNKSYRVYRKLKKHIHHRRRNTRRRNTRRRNTRNTKRSHKSSKSLKRYSKKHRR